MLLESIIPLYYTDIDIWEDLLHNGIGNILNHRWEASLPHIPGDIREAIGECGLHDWIVSSISVFREDSIRVQIDVNHAGTARTLVFDQIKQFNISGDFSLDGLIFPTCNGDQPGIAQILDIWISYEKDIEYAILLNNHRYIRIVTRAPKKKRNKTKDQ